jgi:hypothetical protein
VANPIMGSQIRTIRTPFIFLATYSLFGAIFSELLTLLLNEMLVSTKFPGWIHRLELCHLPHHHLYDLYRPCRLDGLDYDEKTADVRVWFSPNITD